MWDGVGMVEGAPTQGQFPHGAGNVTASHTPALPWEQEDDPGALEYPTLLGRAAGGASVPGDSVLGRRDSGNTHFHGDRRHHWGSLGVKPQHRGVGWCHRGNVEQGQVTKGSEGQVAGAVRSQILAGLEPPGQCPVGIWGKILWFFHFKPLFPLKFMGVLCESAWSFCCAQGVTVLIE